MKIATEEQIHRALSLWRRLKRPDLTEAQLRDIEQAVGRLLVRELR